MGFYGINLYLYKRYMGLFIYLFIIIIIYFFPVESINGTNRSYEIGSVQQDERTLNLQRVTQMNLSV